MYISYRHDLNDIWECQGEPSGIEKPSLKESHTRWLLGSLVGINGRS
jgi:hypothetical protein